MFKRNFKDGYFVPASVLSLYQEGGVLKKYDETAQTQDPMIQLIESAPKVLESNDCDMMKQFVMMFIEVTSGGQQMEGEETESMPTEEEVPMAERGMEIYDEGEDEDLIY